jgi:hypothetical protein
MTMKSDLEAAHSAGRGAVEKLGRTFYWLFAAGIVSARVLEKWLFAKYSLSWLESFLLFLAAVALVGYLSKFIEGRVVRYRQSKGT